MDIHEYQAKEILARFGVPVPRGGLAYSPEQAGYRAHELGGSAWVVKAQIHSGGRGAAGGVKLCRDEHEVAAFAATLFGKQLVTKQTDANGKGVYRLWVEAASDIAREMYLGLVLDRKSERIMIVASAHGGMEIEDLAETDPDSLRRMTVDPAVGLSEFQARELAFQLGLKGGQIAQMVTILKACYRAYRDLDAVMVEINPLVITGAGDLVALDAKMSFDTNALFRQPNVAELRDRSQEAPRESTAGDHGLAYVGLDGDIGCIINGAGLAMATMDMIKLAGGEPANFLDIGGGASPERVVRAFRTVLADRNVSVILVNIFAGINRCDWVAEGVVKACREVGLTIPVVVRLAGTNEEEGKRIIETSGLPLISADTLAEAAAEASLVFVPPPFAADAIMEAADAGIKTAVCVTDGIPSQDMMHVKRFLKRYPEARKMRLIGPNCAGIISPGKGFMGIMPPHIYMPGRIGIAGRSGTLGYEAAAQMKALGIGVSTSVGIGGDPINGSSFKDILELFEADPETDAIMMIGEIGGPQAAEAAAFARDQMKKPVVAYIAGLSAPKGRKMGHAGAIISAFGESAQEKVEILEAAGIAVAPNPSAMGDTMARVLGKAKAA